MNKLPNTPEKPIAIALDAIYQPEIVDYLSSGTTGRVDFVGYPFSMIDGNHTNRF